MNRHKLIKARENELMALAHECKEAGLRVFFKKYSFSNRREYFFASDGVGIAYVDNSDMNYGGWSLSMQYKPSEKFGSGCSIHDWRDGDVNWKPSVQDIMNACAMRRAPIWLIQRENCNKPHWKPTVEPTMYKDIDEWLAKESAFGKITEL